MINILAKTNEREKQDDIRAALQPRNSTLKEPKPEPVYDLDNDGSLSSLSLPCTASEMMVLPSTLEEAEKRGGWMETRFSIYVNDYTDGTFFSFL